MCAVWGSYVFGNSDASGIVAFMFLCVTHEFRNSMVIFVTSCRRYCTGRRTRDCAPRGDPGEHHSATEEEARIHPEAEGAPPDAAVSGDSSRGELEPVEIDSIF